MTAEDEGAEFMRLMTSASRAAKAALDRSFKDLGAHAGQQLIIGALSEVDGLTPRELAERIGVSVPTITVGVQRMEASGLLVRLPDESDARRVRVNLTDRGRELAKILPKREAEVAAKALAGLSGKERSELLTALERIAANLPGA